MTLLTTITTPAVPRTTTTTTDTRWVVRRRRRRPAAAVTAHKFRKRAVAVSHGRFNACPKRVSLRGVAVTVGLGLQPPVRKACGVRHVVLAWHALERGKIRRPLMRRLQNVFQELARGVLALVVGQYVDAKMTMHLIRGQQLYLVSPRGTHKRQLHGLQSSQRLPLDENHFHGIKQRTVLLKKMGHPVGQLFGMVQRARAAGNPTVQILREIDQVHRVNLRPCVILGALDNDQRHVHDPYIHGRETTHPSTL